MTANNAAPAAQEVHNQQQLEREIRSMITALTGHLTNLSRPAGAGGPELGGGDDDDSGGMRIVTLAGTNKGATMEGTDMGDAHGVVYGEDGQLSAFANSNYQAVNNSILLGGSCTAEDPGVHLVITEYVDGVSSPDEENRTVKSKDAEVEKEKEKKTGSSTGREEEIANKKEQPVEN